MNKLSVLLFLAACVFFTSCEKVIGEGPLVTETKTTGSFIGIESQVSGDIFYVQGADYKLELTAQQNILNVIEAPIINNKLVIRFKNNVRVKSHEQITIKVTAPSISSIGASGSGNVTVGSPLTSNDLSFYLSGSGNITLPNVTCSHLEAKLEGSGNISIAGGTATTETFKISGSGNVDARTVLSKSASTNTSGSGTIRLSASETLDVTITGSGYVYYSGTPVVTTTITGSGRVIHQ